MTIDAFVVRPQDKPNALFYILQKIVQDSKIIVFVSTKYHVDYLLALVGKVYQCEGVYGKMDMEQRTNALQTFRKGKSKILIVTDVAARGLDIPAVQFVLHYDYPTNHKTFVHRSGRTARQSFTGHTIALISNNQLPFII